MHEELRNPLATREPDGGASAGSQRQPPSVTRAPGGSDPRKKPGPPGAWPGPGSRSWSHQGTQLLLETPPKFKVRGR